MPGACATHTETGDDNLLRVHAVAGQDRVEQQVQRIFVFGSAPVAPQRIGRDDDRSKLGQCRTYENFEHVSAGPSRVSTPYPEVQSQNEGNTRRRRVVGRNGDRVMDRRFVRTQQRQTM